MAGSLPVAENSHICSGKSLVSGLCAVPLPPVQDAFTWWCGLPVGTRPSPVSDLKWQAGLPGMRAGCQKMSTSRTLQGRHSLNLQLGGYSARIHINPRSGAGSVACNENREMLRGTADIALGMYFTPSSFTPARYDDALKRLEEAGAGSPPGRLYHVAMEADGLIQVFDVWESEASFEAFGKTLLPIMADLGADPGQPQVSPVHNLIKG